MFPSSGVEAWRRALIVILLLVGVVQLAGAGIIKAKAWLAPVLIQRAWQQTLLSDAATVRPWPWADTWPVARLRAPAQGADLLVLAGDSGNALAFGPGHAWASAPLGSIGLAVIGGHRDTHFAFLQELQPNDLLQLELPGGQVRHYRVQTSRVVDTGHETLPVESANEMLLLVTCYPFDTLRVGGPLRYAVSAMPEAHSASIATRLNANVSSYAL
ncbi:MAG: class GN sortase [Halioglobus sp.]